MLRRCDIYTKRDAPFILELRHGGVDPRESGPGLLPRQQRVLVLVPRYLPVEAVSQHHRFLNNAQGGF